MFLLKIVSFTEVRLARYDIGVLTYVQVASLCWVGTGHICSCHVEYLMAIKVMPGTRASTETQA